jgi:hypothetical protein
LRLRFSFCRAPPEPKGIHRLIRKDK